ncbi:hypothetical protein [Moraxella porci]|uniref:hypothetical protein n=1 Tax=Moraxella porci TaxID=1288392 RepID=UPI00244D1EC5|nr:hypothetical protein [Moraxella porci]MDH2273124.1 hypothetical protein [Moraxella porci]
MHALIIGATGATGSALLSQLLADDSVTQVSIFVRKPVAIIDKQISRDDRLQLAYELGADVVDNTGTLDELHAKLGKLHERYLLMAQ